MMRLGKINNRAGSLGIEKKYIRDFPCYEPNYFIGIDYTGDVVPCCNIRSDINNHKPYVLGNVKDNALGDILNSIFAIKFRRCVNNLNFPVVCKSCSKESGRYTSENPSIMNRVT
jgi:radical SAM protein with 4Fe4S-binding SPASM domain